MYANCLGQRQGFVCHTIRFVGDFWRVQFGSNLGAISLGSKRQMLGLGFFPPGRFFFPKVWDLFKFIHRIFLVIGSYLFFPSILLEKGGTVLPEIFFKIPQKERPSLRGDDNLGNDTAKIQKILGNRKLLYAFSLCSTATLNNRSVEIHSPSSHIGNSILQMSHRVPASSCYAY